jgi:hypothetical protein
VLSDTESMCFDIASATLINAFTLPPIRENINNVTSIIDFFPKSL